MAQVVDASNRDLVTVEAVREIAQENLDPGLRNHLITLSYVELGKALADLLGDRENANWCSLAAWPSFSVGRNIRQDQLPRTLESQVASLPLQLRLLATRLIMSGRAAEGNKLARSLGAGNRGVYSEMGYLHALFIELFSSETPLSRDDQEERLGVLGRRIDEMSDPPGWFWADVDRALVKDGFRRYVEAMNATDERLRAQRIFHANALLAEYEQQRLQTWLDLALLGGVSLVRKNLPWITSPRVWVVAEDLWSWLLTRGALVVLVKDEVVRVGVDIPDPPGGIASFPADLSEIDDASLADLLARYDKSIAGDDGRRADLTGTAAIHWQRLGDRMRVILNLARSRQQLGLVGSSPYSAEEAERFRRREPTRSTWQRVEQQVRKGIEAIAPETTPFTGEIAVDVERPPGWSDDELDRLRHVGDPMADSTVADYWGSRELPGVARCIEEVMESSRSGESNVLVDYLSSEWPAPSFVDRAKIEKGKQFFDDWMIHVNLALLFGALPDTYSAAKGVEVLSVVSDLAKSPERRLAQTMRMVVDVMTSDFLDPDTDGNRAIRGVRLMHSAVRHAISRRAPGVGDENDPAPLVCWGSDWDTPLNQEDLVGTMLSFSVTVIDVLERVGVPIDDEAAEAYLHTWCVIGALLGVDERLLVPRDAPERSIDLDEARRRLAIIRSRNQSVSTAGRRMTDILVDWIKTRTGPVMWPAARALMRIGVGDPTADLLGVPARGWTEDALEFANALSRRAQLLPIYRTSFRSASRWLGDVWLGQFLDEGWGANAPFRARPPETVSPRAGSVR